MNKIMKIQIDAKASKYLFISESNGWVDISLHLKYSWLIFIFCILASLLGFSAISEKLSLISLLK